MCNPCHGGARFAYKHGDQEQGASSPIRHSVYWFDHTGKAFRQGRRQDEILTPHRQRWRWRVAGPPVLRATSALMVCAPADLSIRTADAVHLATAQQIGESEVWTDDRRMLAAASYFGLRGRTF